MNAKCTLIAVVIGICLMAPFSRADDVGPDGKTIPESSWQQTTNGISVAMLLDKIVQAGIQKPVLKIYIKNSSRGTEYLPRIGDGIRIQAFYVNEYGSKIPLQNYNQVIHSATSPLGFTMPPMPSVTPYEPGQMVEKIIKLTTDQLHMLKQHTVISKFMYGGIAPGKIIFIETFPIKLAEKQRPNILVMR